MSQQAQKLLDSLGPSPVSIVNRKLLIEVLGEAAQDVLPPLPQEIAVNTKRTLQLVKNALQIQERQNSN
jgi:hypothetical protein